MTMRTSWLVAMAMGAQLATAATPQAAAPSAARIPFMKGLTTVRIAHSPDSDDAFMFYALATHKIDTGDRNYIHLLNDIIFPGNPRG